MCGSELPIDKTKRRRFCDSCRKIRTANYDKHRQEVAKANNLYTQIDKKIERISKNADKTVKTRGTSLTQLLKELDAENAKRRLQGIAPLSYGKYVALISNGTIS